MREQGTHGNSKLAIVAPTGIAFGLAKMYSGHRDDDDKDTNVDVSRKLMEALDWLELPPCRIGPMLSPRAGLG